MVLPAAVTSILIGVTIGVAVMVFTSFLRNQPLMHENFSSDNTEYNSYRPDFNAGDFCPICQDPLKNKWETKRMRCGHFIHKICYEGLVTHDISYCPVCRRNI